jgi:hypothetical protein
MKKSLLCILIIVALLLSACGGNESVSDVPSAPSSSAGDTPETPLEESPVEPPEEPTEEPAPDYAVPPVWEELNASFTRDDSSQYNNAVLNLKYLGEVFALFEFRLMEGSESEDSAFDTILSGIMTINEDGSAAYETAPDAANPLTVHLTLTQTDAGMTADVTSEGNFTISPDGHYDFIEAYIEVSAATSIAILEHLPTAATSLNSNNGAYTINFPDALISDWFYAVEAVFDDTGATLAKFLIAKDLSAVFRADDDITPVLIYGTAQPMMDAYVMEPQYEEETAVDDGGVEAEEPPYEPRMLVELRLPNGVYMQPGATDTLEAVIPGELPYTLAATSEDESIVSVSENGVVTAVAVGETILNCTITCEDGVAMIGLVVTVVEDMEFEEYNA